MTLQMLRHDANDVLCITNITLSVPQSSRQLCSPALVFYANQGFLLEYNSRSSMSSHDLKDSFSARSVPSSRSSINVLDGSCILLFPSKTCMAILYTRPASLRVTTPCLISWPAVGEPGRNKVLQGHLARSQERRSRYLSGQLPTAYVDDARRYERALLACMLVA